MGSSANRNFFQIIFTSPNGSRLRAGWRILVHTLLIGLISIPVGVVIFIPVGVFSISFDSPVSLLASELTMVIAITAATYLSRRFLDKQSFVSMGLPLNIKAFRDILVGIGITFIQMGLAEV